MELIAGAVMFCTAMFIGVVCVGFGIYVGHLLMKEADDGN